MLIPIFDLRTVNVVLLLSHAKFLAMGASLGFNSVGDIVFIVVFVHERDLLRNHGDYAVEQGFMYVCCPAGTRV